MVQEVLLPGVQVFIPEIQTGQDLSPIMVLLLQKILLIERTLQPEIVLQK